MSSVNRPFLRTYRTLQTWAHEKPALFYSVILGCVGPLAVVVVPPIRQRFGYVQPERPPTTYPLPNRPRREVHGYDD